MPVYAFHTTDTLNTRQSDVPAYRLLEVKEEDDDAFTFFGISGEPHFAIWRGSAHANGNPFFRAVSNAPVTRGEKYAVFFKPRNADYNTALTPGKLYRVTDTEPSPSPDSDYGFWFTITTDSGHNALCLERGCAHIGDGDWYVVEPGIAEFETDEKSERHIKRLKAELDEVKRENRRLTDVIAAIRIHADKAIGSDHDGWE